MNRTLLERRDELIVERGALIQAMKRMKALFIAVFAEELTARWEWLAKTWLASLETPSSPERMVGFGEEMEALRSEARSIANAALSRNGVWGHEESLPAIAAKRPYAEVGDGPRWSHVSPAMAEAEEHVLTVLERRLGPGPDGVVEAEVGVLSEPLVEMVTMYAGAFASLQKVDRVLKRIKEQTPRPRPSLTGEDGQPFGR